VIPYCTKYMDAQNESNIIVFMKEGLHIQGDNDIEKLFHQMKKALQPGKYERAETDYFFHRSCLAIEKMFDQINIPVKKEYRKGKRYE